MLRRTFLIVIILILCCVSNEDAFARKKKKKKKARTVPNSFGEIETLANAGIDLLSSSSQRDKLFGASKLIKASEALAKVDPVGSYVEAVADFSMSHFMLSISFLRNAKAAKMETDIGAPVDHPTLARTLFRPMNSHLLTFRSGDMFEVISAEYGGWWKVRVIRSGLEGSVKGTVGLLPYNFVVFSRPTSVDPIADLIWAEKHGLLDGIKSDDLARSLVNMLFAGRGHILTTYDLLIGNAPGLETFWHDLASKISMSGPGFIQHLMATQNSPTIVKFKFRDIVSYLKSIAVEAGENHEHLDAFLDGDSELVQRALEKYEEENVYEAIDKDEDKDATPTSLFDWGKGSDFSASGVKKALESQYGYIEDIETLRNAIEIEHARRAALEKILVSNQDDVLHDDILEAGKRNQCEGGVCDDSSSSSSLLSRSNRTSSSSLLSAASYSEGGFLSLVLGLISTVVWHIKVFIWSGVNGIFMCISILISSSQLLTLVAHRDVLDSSSPEDVFHLLIGFVMIVSMITVIPFESLQNAISPVRELLYFNSLLSLLSWHCFLEYDMDTNTGRFHLLTQMLLSTTAVLTTASQTWLKWDFVIWIACCLATLNHAAEQKWGDGSLSPWLWQIPGAYIAYAFPSDSVPGMISTALSASQITYIGSSFLQELMDDLIKSKKSQDEEGEGEGSNKSRSGGNRLSLRAQLRHSLATGATIVRRHGVSFRLKSSSNDSGNNPIVTTLDKAAARRHDQQQAALERKRKKKEELRLRQLRKKEKKDEERLKEWNDMICKVVEKSNQIRQSPSDKKILQAAESLCSEFQKHVHRAKGNIKDGSESAVLLNLSRHLKNLQNAVKHARNARRKKLREQCETELQNALKNTKDRKGLESAVSMAKRNDMTSLDLYVVV